MGNDLVSRVRFSTTLNKEIKSIFQSFVEDGNLKTSTICDEALVDVMIKYGYPVPEKFIKKNNMRFTNEDK